MKKILIITLGLCTACLLASCSTTKPPPSAYQIAPLPHSASTYLAQTQSSEGDAKTQSALFAATRLLQDDSINAAAQQLNRVARQPLNTEQTAHLRILQAYLNLKRDRVRVSIRELRTVRNPQALPDDLRLKYFQISSVAYQRSDNLTASLFAQLNVNRMENYKNRAQVKTLWYELQNLPIQKLQTLMQNSSDTHINAWLSLAIIAKQYSNQPQQLVQAIEQWQEQNPNQPANQLIPNKNTLNSLAQNSVGSIALLLPLQGKFGAMGRAVRDGFMAAYYNQTAKLKPAPRIKIYDTSTANIKTLYQQALQNGAQFIIGPLTKTNVAQLVDDVSIQVPTLALNYTSDSISSPQLLEFGLSPQQAAKQVATKAWQHGVSKILMITPRGDWGNSVAQAFRTRWQQLGGRVVASLAYENKNLNQQISTLLKVKQSKEREQQLQKALKKKLDFVPRRRLDTNGIFLVAPPETARQIRPLLKFYFAGRLPIFSTSLIYNGYQQAARNRDLDNIYFADMPWVLDNSAGIKQLRGQVKRGWPSGYRAYARLYGIGVDALTLSRLFHRLIALPNFGIDGVSGRLYLNSNQHIYRQLSWAKIKKGRAISLS